MTKTDQRKPAYRLWWFWLLVLVLVYAVAGFALVPLYLAAAIPDRLQQHLGWTAEVDDVSFNPFTFTAAVTDLQAWDDQELRIFTAEKLSVNLGLLQLVKGTVHFQELLAVNPYLRADLLEGGELNLSRDWQRNFPEDQSFLTDGGAAVSLGEAVVNGGRLQIRDLRRGNEAREYWVEPVGLTLSNIVSWDRDEAGKYTLQAVADEQVLEASGTLSLSPAWSNGELTLSNVGSSTLESLLAPWVPYQVREGMVSLTTSYQFAWDDQGIALATREGTLRAEGLKLADPESPDEELARAGRIDMDGIAFNLEGPELLVSVIDGEEVGLQAVMSRNGQLNLTAPLTRLQQESAGSNPGGPPLRWSVGNVKVSSSTIDWRDNRPETPVQLELDEVELTLGAMTEQLEEPVSYQARSTLREGGTFSANGQFTLAPLTFEGGVNLDQVVLAPFNGYLQEVSQLDVQDGTLNLSGNIDIDVQDDPLTGTFSGRGSISHFSGHLLEEDEPILSWRELQLDPIEYNFAPARLELGTVILSEPELEITNRAAGGHNLMDLFRPRSSEQSPESEAAGAGSEEASDDSSRDLKPIFRLRQLELASGEVRYVDETISPRFATRVHALDAMVSGLSNITPQQGRFTVGGKVDDSGSLKAEGSIATLGTDQASDLEVQLSEIAIPMLDPYFRRYLGYRADGGKLSLDGEYRLRGSRIEASNVVRLNRLELGEATGSEEATTEPVKLGLALLRDGSGQVRLDISVDGDLADPQFDLGPVMMRSFASAVTKAASSPFTLLGSVVDLAGFSADEIGEVAFMPGETTLMMGEYTKMATLAEALRSRDRLVLALRGVAMESVDIPALEAGLEEDESLPEGALEELAAQRGKTLKRLLEEEYEVSPEQIFLRAPEVSDGDGSKDSVSLEFELESQ